jgi:hypothetical protein
VVALLLAAVATWALAPTYPNYDAYFHLDWGRQLLRGMAPSFTAYAAPTEHPLYVALAGVAALFGHAGDRVLVLFTVLSWVALIYGIFRLGRAVFGWAPGLAAAVFVGSSPAFLLYAAKAFVDMPFITLVIWAGVLATAPRVRPVAVMSVLTLAGLLRPEVWPLALAWWLWRARERPGRRHLAVLAVVGLAAPVGWALCDLAVTGDLFFSIHSTSALAGALGRLTSRAQLPVELVRFLASAVRPPVALIAVAGFVLAWRAFGLRRLAVPLALLGGGIVAFFGLGLVGQPVQQRYLTVPAVALCLFAGYGLFGWVGLEHAAPRRRLWSILAATGLVLGFVYAAFVLPKLGRFADELRFVRNSHDQLVALVRNPAVSAARRCGSIAFPTYRLVPDTRWILDVADADAVARTDPARRPGGPIVIVHGHKAVGRFGLAAGIPHRTNHHPRRAPVIARSGPFTAYGGRC